MANGGGNANNLQGAGAAAAQGPPAACQACPLKQVSPVIKVAAPKIVLVKKAYQTKPHRIKVHLNTDKKFTGTGSLTSAQSAQIQVFDKQSGGTLLPLPLALTAGDLTKGRDVWVQALKESTAVNDTTLTLTITGGDKTVVNSPANDTLTRVLLQLDLCHYKPKPGGADPAPLSDADKISVGRNLHLQDKRLLAGRCLLIVHQAKPAAYAGNVVLIAQRTGGLRTFPYAQEVPTTGEAAASASPLSTANTDPALAGGLKLWVEGAKVSGKVLDSGFTLEISDLPHQEGDRANITVVQTRADACQSRAAAKDVPKPVEDGKKMNPGRFVHLQDTGNHHGRARVAVQRVTPKDFTGKLEVAVWDATAKSMAGPRLKLFAAEAVGGAALANPAPLNFPGGWPAKGDAELWAEGAVLSPAVRDTEVRLRVADAEGWIDQAALTVCQFSVLKADIPSTPALNNRAGNSPVNRHEWKIADPAPASKDFDEDYATNKPFVLIENSVKSSDQVKLTVKIKPAGVPVRWAVIRDRRASPNGDNKKVIDLSGNKEAPSLAFDAERLDNTLQADAVGSFHICPYVDCNGDKKLNFMANDGTRIDREPFIMMNLVLVRIQAVKNDSVGQPLNCSAFPAAGQTAANFGGFTTSSSAGGAWTGANSGWHADATVDVIGGGDDGKRGLDHVFGGWVQHIFLNGIKSVYNIPAPPPPPPPPPPAVAPPPPPAPAPRSHQYAFISNLPDNTHFGDYHYIKATESASQPAHKQVVTDPHTDANWVIKTAPTLDANPILDVSPFGNEGTGGDSCVGSTGAQGGTTGAHGGGYPAAVAQPIGERWQREMWDGPGIGCRSFHISAGGSLASFRFNLGFRTDLCFWTSTELKPDPSATAVANRLYVSVYKCTWSPDFAIKFHPTTGVGTITTAAKIPITKAKSAGNGRAVPVDGFGMETRAPFALAWYAVDATN